MTPARSTVKVVLIPVVLLLAQACSRTPGMPDGWGPLRFAADSSCPRVSGTYDASDRDFSHIVATQFLPYDTTRGTVESISLALEDDSTLSVIAWVDREPRDTVRLHAHREFECGDGWLEPRYPRSFPNSASDDAIAHQRQSGRSSLRIAAGAKGALVGRLDHHTYDEFNVWCGDGCKGFPVPWTWRTSHRWYRAAVVDPRTHQLTESPEAGSLTAQDRRLMREEARLEGRE
jgi:hypothetical protein